MPTPRKPTHLKVISGTTRPHKRGQRENTAEPKPVPLDGVPVAPPTLSEWGRQAWPEVARILYDMGILTGADGLALERLCETRGEILMLRASYTNPVEILKPDGDGYITVAHGGEPTYVTYGKSGPMLRVRPELAAIADADRRFRAYLNDFGLTPAARSKVQTPKSDESGDPTGFFD